MGAKWCVLHGLTCRCVLGTDMRVDVQWRNCQLEHLKRKRGAWMEKQEANERKKAMFAEFLEDEAPKAVVEEKEVEEEVDESAEIDDIFNTRRPRVCAMSEGGGWLDRGLTLETRNAAPAERGGSI